MALDHERERAVVVAAVSGVLDRCWVPPGELGDLDWAWTLRWLRDRGLTAYLFSEATRSGIAGSLPAAALELLRQDAEQNAVESAQLVASLLRAAADLDGAGVDWLPLKGGALGLVTPAYAAVRNTSDLDLLVRPEQVDRAAEALARGREIVTRAKDGYGRWLTVEKADVLAVHHLWILCDPEGVRIELHHSVPGAARPGSTGELWSRAMRVTARSAQILVPSLDDLLGTACTHVLGHHRDDARLMLRHLADVRALEAAGASPATAAARYDVDGLRTVASSFEHLRDALAYAVERHAPVPAAARWLDEASAEGGLRGWGVRADERRRRVVRRLRASGVEAILPSRATMVELYGPAASGPRLPLLHAHRWGAILWRMVRGR